MIGPVRIQNFKSIRQLEFDAKRVNLFIGEPNTGKSNLLEALALVSTGVHRQEIFKEIYRFKTVADLFFDQDISKTVSVQASEFQCSLNFNGRQFIGAVSKKGQGDQPWNLEKDGRSNQQPLPQFGVRYYLF